MKMNTSNESTGPYKQHFIGSGGFGKVFVNPKTRSRVVKIIEFDEKENIQQICENETKFCKLFSDQAQKLGSQDFRLAPHVYGSAKYKIPRSSKHIICIESERFIGDLAWGLEHDRLFKTYLLDFSNRMAIYLQLIKALKHISQMGFKHSDIKPQNILYKLKKGSWVGDQMAPLDHQNIEYQVVFTDFGLTSKHNTFREGRNHRYTDPSDFKGKVYYFSKYQERVELFPLGLVFMFVESSLFASKIDPNQEPYLLDKLREHESYTESLRLNRNSRFRLGSICLSEFFNFILNNVSLINLRKASTIENSYDTLQDELQYLSTFMGQYFQYQAMKQFVFKMTQDSILEEFGAFFQRFLTILCKMCRKNRMRGGRPSFQTLIFEFTKIRTEFGAFKTSHNLVSKMIKRHRFSL